MEDEYNINGFEVVEKEVTEIGNGAHAIAPKQWVGETVKLVRVTDKHQDE